MADQKNQERCQEVDDYIAGFEAPVRERLEAVTLAQVDGSRRPIPGTEAGVGRPNVLLKRISLTVCRV